MAQRKTMMIPVNNDDLAAVQGWLQAMATQGLLLEACDNGMFVFQKSTPTQRRYRVDPSKGTTLAVAPPKMMDMYREFGWHYVDSYDRYHHVFYTDDPNAVEPFLSSSELVEKLAHLRRQRIFVCATSLGMLLLMGTYTWGSRDPMLFALDAALLASIAYDSFLNLKSISATEQTAHSGKPFDPDTVLQDPKLRLSRAIGIALVVLLVALLAARRLFPG